jgi:hypothetical protein
MPCYASTLTKSAVLSMHSVPTVPVLTTAPHLELAVPFDQVIPAYLSMLQLALCCLQVCIDISKLPACSMSTECGIVHSYAKKTSRFQRSAWAGSQQAPRPCNQSNNITACTVGASC